MKLSRVISLCLVILTAAALFGACGKSEDGGTDTASGTASAASITVIKDGMSDFIIVRPAENADNEMDAAKAVFQSYKEKMSVTLKNTNDEIARQDGVYEIIIGDTNRPETEAAKQLLKENSNMYAKDFIVCAQNGNIVIYCASDEYYLAAAEYFISTYVEAAEIPGDLVDVQKDTAAYGTLSIGGNVNLYGYSIVRSHYETSYLTQLELEKLHTAILDRTGYNVPVAEDAYVTAGDKEIIIGGCDREGQAKIDNLDEYEIRISGSKVYIDGGSDYAVAVAVTELTNDIKAGDLTLSEGVYKTGSYADTIKKYDSSSFYSLVWADEFNESTIDTSVWHICTGDDRSSVAPDGKPVYRSTSDTTFVHDGALYQCAAKTDDAYYGGMLHTFNTLHFKYGYIEIKAKVPDGDGFWAGFWLNGTNWANKYTDPDANLFAEFDIMESYGNATGFTPALHRWPTATGAASGIEQYTQHTTPTYTGEYANSSARKINCPDDKLFSDDFHTFGCYWTPEVITITCDGMPHLTLDTTQDPLDKEAFNNYEFIILSLATYFQSCPLTPNATEYEWENTNMFIVDYIRLFQNDECFLKWL